MRAWLYRSAVRSYIDKYRRDKRYYEILQRDFFRKEAVVLYDLSDYEELYEAVVELSDNYRIVIDLYYFQDMSVKESAHILGCSQGAVKTNLHRGREQLAQILEEKGYEYENF